MNCLIRRYGEKAWKEDPYTGVNKLKRAGVDPAHSFDSSAKPFDKEVFSEEGRRRARWIMNWLKDVGGSGNENNDSQHMYDREDRILRSP
ncbi:hypothetical protein [Paenibacillus azoreducens]|uniref:Uncharacterized protein n=1 Tax=Paenibacillus azoreducens TaxID=116718 RepID=A0A919YG52_9BACL|nr:hypothetical protein [Paenibacillus azoreducens]GIO50582.1 hypothetical protein J34TS1_53470 [Paenibacillus azoreducens]